MSRVDFWISMHEGGDVIVDDIGDERSDAPSLEQAIGAIESQWRQELAFEPPALVMPVAVWATTLIYRASQCLVYRQIEAPTVEKMLNSPCPASLSPEVCYSADLALQALPGLLSLARGVAADDPLALALHKLAHDWPLSSVGVADLKDLDISAFVEHPSLRRLYADRIIDRRDISRLSDERAAAAVREALGAFGDELASSIARHLRALDGSVK